VSAAFDAMVGALGDDVSSFAGLQTEALVDRMLVTNRSLRPELPAGWNDALEDIANLVYVSKSNASFEPETTSLVLTGATALSAEQTTEIMAILTGAGVLQPSVSVTYRTGDDTATSLYGAAE
jgi:hypothetical protein